VLYWIPKGRVPSEADIRARLEHCASMGRRRLRLRSNDRSPFLRCSRLCTVNRSWVTPQC
jgi:hypothetical protein